MARLGKVTEFRDGLRVTDAETLDIARMVLVGKVNRDIVSAINVHGPLAVGLSGEDASLITAAARSAATSGYVGDVLDVDPTILRRLLAEGLIPVVATIGADAPGQAYNINADTVAGAVAEALDAEKLVFLTDVDGLRADPDDPETAHAARSPRPSSSQMIAVRGGRRGHGPKGRGLRPGRAGRGRAGPTSSTGGCPTPCCSSCSPRGGGNDGARDRAPHRPPALDAAPTPSRR